MRLLAPDTVQPDDQERRPNRDAWFRSPDSGLLDEQPCGRSQFGFVNFGNLNSAALSCRGSVEENAFWSNLDGSPNDLNLSNFRTLLNQNFWFGRISSRSGSYLQSKILIQNPDFVHKAVLRKSWILRVFLINFRKSAPLLCQVCKNLGRFWAQILIESILNQKIQIKPFSVRTSESELLTLISLRPPSESLSQSRKRLAKHLKTTRSVQFRTFWFNFFFRPNCLIWGRV